MNRLSRLLAVVASAIGFYGCDSADLAALKVSYVSPLAEALMGAHVGDRVTWHRPAGDLELTVERIAYDGADPGAG